MGWGITYLPLPSLSRAMHGVDRKRWIVDRIRGQLDRILAQLDRIRAEAGSNTGSLDRIPFAWIGYECVVWIGYGVFFVLFRSDLPPSRHGCLVSWCLIFFFVQEVVEHDSARDSRGGLARVQRLRTSCNCGGWPIVVFKKIKKLIYNTNLTKG